MKRRLKASNDEPEQRIYELPSEGNEHLFQVVDKWIDKNDDNIIITRIEVAEGDETGRTILHRVNLNQEWNGFFLTRLFLKAINEPYKGDFDVDDDMWIGRCFYATVIHNQAANGKTYANIDQFNFEKKPETGLETKENKTFFEKQEEVGWDDDK